MKLNMKQMRVYIALGCNTMDDVRALKRMIKQVLNDDRLKGTK